MTYFSLIYSGYCVLHSFQHPDNRPKSSSAVLHLLHFIVFHYFINSELQTGGKDSNCVNLSHINQMHHNINAGLKPATTVTPLLLSDHNSICWGCEVSIIAFSIFGLFLSAMQIAYKFLHTPQCEHYMHWCTQKI